MKEYGNSTKMVGPKTEQGLYEAEIRQIKRPAECAMVNSEDRGNLCNRNLGHFSTDLLRKSVKDTKGIPENTLIVNENSICTYCILGKSCRKPRKPQNPYLRWEITPLQFVFSDVVGLVRKPSFWGSLYFATLICEENWFSLLQFLRRKSHAPDAVKSMFSEISTNVFSEMNRLVILNHPEVTRLWTHGGGKYVCRYLKGRLTKKGTVHELTTPYSKESNGKSERLSRTLLDCDRSMMLRIMEIEKEKFWAEAVNIAIFW